MDLILKRFFCPKNGFDFKAIFCPKNGFYFQAIFLPKIGLDFKTLPLFVVKQGLEMSPWLSGHLIRRSGFEPARGEFFKTRVGASSRLHTFSCLHNVGARLSLHLDLKNCLQGQHEKHESKAGTDVMILKIFFPKISAKKLAFLTQNKAKLCKIFITTLVFEKNAIFSQKIVKIAENCDHNIDP
jgi:hypothetical protein